MMQGSPRLERPGEGSGLLDARAVARQEAIKRPARTFTVGRMNDNELILFAEAARESWIVYPPRSAYGHIQRPSADSTVVEHHPWAPYSPIEDHVVRPAEGCTVHGIECGAYAAVKAATEMGWNPFG